MRVLVTIADLSGPGGVAHYYRALRKHLPVNVEYLPIGTRYAGRNLPRPLRMVLDLLLFLQKAASFDMVHVNPSLCARCYFREAILILAARALRKRVIVFFRGWERDYAAALDRSKRRLFRAAFARVDAMIVLGAEFEDAVRRWGYAGPVFRETTAIDEDLLCGIGPRPAPTGAGPLRVLFLSRMERAKGLYESIEAMRLLNDPRIHMIFGGDGGEADAFARHLAKTQPPGVTYLGYLRGEAKKSALRDADVFLLASYGEGMPNSVLEAMAFGLPVITTRTGGVADFFEDEKMGLVVSARDAGAIAKSIRRLADDPAWRERISRYNADYARTRFYSSRVAERLMSIYQAVVESGGRG